jgi:hypothetical protein
MESNQASRQASSRSITDRQGAVYRLRRWCRRGASGPADSCVDAEQPGAEPSRRGRSKSSGKDLQVRHRGLPDASRSSLPDAFPVRPYHLAETVRRARCSRRLRTPRSGVLFAAVSASQLGVVMRQTAACQGPEQFGERASASNLPLPCYPCLSRGALATSTCAFHAPPLPVTLPLPRRGPAYVSLVFLASPLLPCQRPHPGALSCGPPCSFPRPPHLLLSAAALGAPAFDPRTTSIARAFPGPSPTRGGHGQHEPVVGRSRDLSADPHCDNDLERGVPRTLVSRCHQWGC